MEKVLLRVSTKSIPNKVASTIVGMTREGKLVELQGIGNGALGQIDKAIAIANKFVLKEKFEFWTKPLFVDLEVEENNRTGMKFVLKILPIV